MQTKNIKDYTWNKFLGNFFFIDNIVQRIHRPENAQPKSWEKINAYYWPLLVHLWVKSYIIRQLDLLEILPYFFLFKRNCNAFQNEVTTPDTRYRHVTYYKYNIIVSIPMYTVTNKIIFLSNEKTKICLLYNIHCILYYCIITYVFGIQKVVFGTRISWLRGGKEFL